MRRKHVTLQLLWREYRAAHPDGYGYSFFCQHYRSFEKRIDVVMRQHHVAGEKLFVDWAGDKLPYIDPESGEVREASLFLAVLGASNYTYAEAFADERTESFLAAHARAFEFFGGAPELIVPDNLKTGVAKADRYEAEIHAPYRELAAHYGAAVLPARAGKPRDKACASDCSSFEVSGTKSSHELVGMHAAPSSWSACRAARLRLW
jgi:transposase